MYRENKGEKLKANGRIKERREVVVSPKAEIPMISFAKGLEFTTTAATTTTSTTTTTTTTHTGKTSVISWQFGPSTPSMHSSRQIHLPTEIVVSIVSFAAADEDDARRQRTMYACCLLSHQWYSAAVAFLYEKPRLGKGLAFKKFTDTVCPPIAARKSKLNLGSLVRRLDLSILVHHSTNSLTSRLLGRVKENLEVLMAPSVSFA